MDNENELTNVGYLSVLVNCTSIWFLSTFILTVSIFSMQIHQSRNNAKRILKRVIFNVEIKLDLGRHVKRVSSVIEDYFTNLAEVGVLNRQMLT